MQEKNENGISKRTDVAEFVPIDNRSDKPLREYVDLKTVEEMIALQAAALAAFMNERNDDREFYLEQRVAKKGIIFSKKYTTSVVLKRRPPKS